MLGNLFGTLERAKFVFRDALESVRRLVELKVDPAALGRNPWRYRGTPRTLWRLLPRRVRSGPILAHRIAIDQLPQIQCWPMDGGPFVTLPQVYTEDPTGPGLARSNLGMYRIQLAGNQYEPNHEVGLHYQIHRGIGVHHAAAIRRGEPLRVNVFVGGPPALTVAAVMPLPEGLPELAFAGALGGRRVAMVAPDGVPAHAGRGRLRHLRLDRSRTSASPRGRLAITSAITASSTTFPVLRVERVYHREGAIWPFTSVGRPPQEDTTFGALIHELTGPIIPSVHPGRARRACRRRRRRSSPASGHRQRAVRARRRRAAAPGDPDRRQRTAGPGAALAGQVPADRRARGRPVARHPRHPGLLRATYSSACDWRTDLHFQTRTTIDTLDYSGHGLNQGSKVVIAAAGPRGATLADRAARRLAPARAVPRSAGRAARHPGIQGPLTRTERTTSPRSAGRSAPDDPIRGFPLIVIVDDSEFTARNERNFLWVTFTRSDPGRRHRGDRGLHRQEALGLHRPAGHRRADQAAPRASPGR